MRVNPRVFVLIDMTGSIRIPDCPSQFKVIAENIINMATTPGYSAGKYNTMTELDKTLMLQYWRMYDGMKPVINCDTVADFNKWFIHKATAPELIRRARQWLAEHQWILLDESVAERAYQAGQKFSRAIKEG